jgi:hypothetical protein
MVSLASTQLGEVWGGVTLRVGGWGWAGCRAEGAVLPVKADGIHCVDVSVCVAVALSAYVSIRQHTSAYVSIRQHTSAYVSIRHSQRRCLRWCRGGTVSIRQHTLAYVSIRQHTSAVSIKSAYGIHSVDVSVGVAVALSK